MPEPTAPAPSASSEQDRAWIAEALRGDQRAYERLVGKYERALYHHILRLVRSRDDVDDLVQETFIKAFAALEAYTPQYAFSTWLYKIATNHAIDHLRKRRIATTSIDRPIQTKDGEMQMELPDDTYRPDKPLVEDQRRTLLAEAVEQLPDKYRRVIEMRHQQEMTYEDIAETLDLPLGTVKAHIFRARELLNRYLRDRRDSL
ncbi:MAG: sigma-70 family RNA polymerase sigma factor [Rhodothermales bacterium]|nr:sigma-70 family RNA polymerase sigma factor [Rhodothermales bacterium]